MTEERPWGGFAEMGPLAAALAKAQAAFPAIPRDKEVTVRTKTAGTYTFKYAPLDRIIDAVRPALAANGLAFVQLLEGPDLVTMLLHETGASLTGRVPLGPADTVQQLGSAITYLRRYALQAMLGIAAEDDDDGNAAAGNRMSQRDAIADAAVARQGIVSGPPPWDTKAATYDAGLIGVAKVGKNDADFERRETPDGPRVAFSLTDGTRKIKAVALGDLAELLLAHREAIEGQRVTGWGRIDDETYTAKATKPGEKPFTNVYQVLTLSRLKVGDLDLSEPDRDDIPDDSDPPIAPRTAAFTAEDLSLLDEVTA